MAQWPACDAAIPLRAGLSPSCFPCDPAPLIKGLGKQQKMDQEVLAPSTHMENPEEAPGSCLWLGPGLVVVAT